MWKINRLSGSGLSQTPNPSKTPSSQLRTPLSKTDETPLRKGLSQTPLTRFGNLSGVLSQESDEEEDDEERMQDKGIEIFSFPIFYCSDHHIMTLSSLFLIKDKLYIMMLFLCCDYFQLVYPFPTKGVPELRGF